MVLKRKEKVLETFYVKWNVNMKVNYDRNKNICEAINSNYLSM